jgi:hypothetical protein
MFEGFFFVFFFAFKENVIEGDGPKNQTQSKMDLYETTVNRGAHLFNKLYYLLIAWVSIEYI